MGIPIAGADRKRLLTRARSSICISILEAKQELKSRDEEQVESALSTWLAALDQEDPD